VPWMAGYAIRTRLCSPNAVLHFRTGMQKHTKLGPNSMSKLTRNQGKNGSESLLKTHWKTNAHRICFFVIFGRLFGHIGTWTFGLFCPKWAPMHPWSGIRHPKWSNLSNIVPSWCLQSRKSAKNRSRVNLNSPEMVPKMPTNGSQ